MGISASGLEVSHLLAVRTLDAGYCQIVNNTIIRAQCNQLTIARLGAVLAHVSHLITVAALDEGLVARLGALFSLVAILTAVAATTRAGRGAISGEVTNFKHHVSSCHQTKHHRESYSRHNCGTQHQQPSGARGSPRSCVHLGRNSCKQTCQRGESGLGSVSVAFLNVFGRLTVTDTVSNRIAIVALDVVHILRLSLFLGAGLGGVAKLVASSAFGQTAASDLTGILEALKVLLHILGPDLTVTGTRGVPLEAVRDGVLLLKLTLEIHVGKGRRQRFLDGDEPQLDVLVAKSLLEVGKCGLGRRLDVNLDSFFDIVDLTLLDSVDNHSPCILSGHVRQMAAVDLASSLAGDSLVA
ncbi:hypothetical protein B0T25DRAFT_78396 [Lasiosphaeria hispida]|uniref:Uncharacterized protein n=1 Tax=Lasiosphaeria hispida TaxID=260671 RepID=A0AAJ0HPC6_9PEZI|nr:hypothetical protein B0T25DRAFT_78396 [Lasiosphaeria hispida]